MQVAPTCKFTTSYKKKQTDRSIYQFAIAIENSGVPGSQLLRNGYIIGAMKTGRQENEPTTLKLEIDQSQDDKLKFICVKVECALGRNYINS